MTECLTYQSCFWWAAARCPFDCSRLHPQSARPEWRTWNRPPERYQWISVASGLLLTLGVLVQVTRFFRVEDRPLRSTSLRGQNFIQCVDIIEVQCFLWKLFFIISYLNHSSSLASVLWRFTNKFKKVKWPILSSTDLRCLCFEAKTGMFKILTLDIRIDQRTWQLARKVVLFFHQVDCLHHCHDLWMEIRGGYAFESSVELELLVHCHTGRVLVTTQRALRKCHNSGSLQNCSSTQKSFAIPRVSDFPLPLWSVHFISSDKTDWARLSAGN